jgi:hypothetical protein
VANVAISVISFFFFVPKSAFVVIVLAMYELAFEKDIERDKPSAVS